MKHNGAILILSGPSGAGKSSLYKALAEEFPNHYFSVSSTTREKRQGEIDNVHYHFISEEEFTNGIRNGEFLEWAKVHGNYYGTSSKQIINALADNKLVIFDVDVQGQKSLKQIFPNHTTSVFITTPNKTTLKMRLESRGSNTKEDIERRLDDALAEVESIANFDYLVVNDDLERAAKELVGIAIGAFCKTSLYQIEPFLQNWEN